MGISTQVISQAAQTAANQGLSRSVAVVNAGLNAQGTISNGTLELAKAAVAENSTVTLTETRVTFYDNPINVRTGPVRPGQLVLTPPEEGQAPKLTNLYTPGVYGLPTSEKPEQFEPNAVLRIPSVQGDLSVPGGMARLEDVSLGAIAVEASPRAPQIVVPVLSTSPSENTSRPGIEAAAQQYVQVVLVGSAQSVGSSALPSEGPTGP